MTTVRQQRDATTLMIALCFLAFVTGYWLGSFDSTANRVTAIFTVILTAVAVQQVRVSLQMNRLTQSIERGFLSIKTTAVIEVEQRQLRRYRVRVEMRNTGKTPLHLERMIAYVARIDEEKPGVVPHALRELGEYLAPGDEFSTNEYDVFIDYKLAAPDEIGVKRALIVGVIEYRDEFGVRRMRGFAYQFGLSELSQTYVPAVGKSDTEIDLTLSLPYEPGFHYDRER